MTKTLFPLSFIFHVHRIYKNTESFEYPILEMSLVRWTITKLLYSYSILLVFHPHSNKFSFFRLECSLSMSNITYVLSIETLSINISHFTFSIPQTIFPLSLVNVSRIICLSTLSVRFSIFLFTFIYPSIGINNFHLFNFISTDELPFVDRTVCY